MKRVLGCLVAFFVGVFALSPVLITSPSASAQSPGDDVLTRSLEVERLPNGNTLIADGGDWNGSGGKVLEVDPSGRVVWKYTQGMVFTHSAERLKSGNTLITDTSNDRVIEVDPSGKIVWSTDSFSGGTGKLSDGSHLNYPNDAEELPNGHILQTDRNNDRVIEYDRQGKLYWTYTKLKRPHNPDRLANGNTMISDSDANMAIEVDPAGNIVWSYGGNGVLNWPRDADRLANGNTLITDSRNNRVIEVDKAGKVVWSYATDLSSPYESDRLPNGNTLIADGPHARVVEVDPSGKIVWQFRNLPDPKYPSALANGGFEEESASAKGFPAAWERDDLVAELPPGERGKFTWDSAVFHSGQRSAAIEYHEDGWLWWSQAVAVKPGEKYDFTGWIKTQDMKDKVAQFELVWSDSMGGAVSTITPEKPDGTKGYRGTVDWTKETVRLEAPAKAVAMEIRASVRGKGKAWFDDMSFTPVSDGLLGLGRVAGLDTLWALLGSLAVAVVLVGGGARLRKGR